MVARLKKIEEAIEQLEAAVIAYEKQRTDGKEKKTVAQLHFLALVKAFEVLVEYAWKELKAKVEDEGLDAASPKETIRQAAKLGLLAEPEKWIDCINTRNLSVHDDFGIPEPDYVKLATGFLLLVKKAIHKITTESQKLK